MTKTEYQDAGFRLSLQVEQAQIDRAEKAVIDAYIVPIVGVVDTDEEVTKLSVMNLAFLWLLQHGQYVTRGGAKDVQITSASTPANDNILTQCSQDCHLALQALREAYGKDDVKVKDICRIYFSTNFFVM